MRIIRWQSLLAVLTALIWVAPSIGCGEGTEPPDPADDDNLDDDTADDDAGDGGDDSGDDYSGDYDTLGVEYAIPAKEDWSEQGVERAGGDLHRIRTRLPPHHGVPGPRDRDLVHVPIDRPGGRRQPHRGPHRAGPRDLLDSGGDITLYP